MGVYIARRPLLSARPSCELLLLFSSSSNDRNENDDSETERRPSQGKTAASATVLLQLPLLRTRPSSAGQRAALEAGRQTAVCVPCCLYYGRANDIACTEVSFGLRRGCRLRTEPTPKLTQGADVTRLEPSIDAVEVEGVLQDVSRRQFRDVAVHELERGDSRCRFPRRRCLRMQLAVS